MRRERVNLGNMPYKEYKREQMRRLRASRKAAGLVEFRTWCKPEDRRKYTDLEERIHRAQLQHE